MSSIKTNGALASAYRKIERADQHISDLVSFIQAFHDSGPYHAHRETENDRYVWRFHFVPGRYPDEIALLAGDAAHNLRSALDHMAYVAAGTRAGPDTAFPIWRRTRPPTASELKSLVLGKVQGASPKAIDMFLACECYIGGNHQFLWEVNNLDITDKHRKLLIATTSYRSVGLDLGALWRSLNPEIGELPEMHLPGLRPAVSAPLNDGDELFSAPIEHDPGNPKFTFDIAFNESGPLQGELIVPKLTQLRNAVEAIIDTFIPEFP